VLSGAGGPLKPGRSCRHLLCQHEALLCYSVQAVF
jgi:hypothetical protein